MAQVNVNLAFTADTQQAKMQLQSLQTQLNQITTGTKIGSGIEKDIQGAIRAASELSIHLKKATNVNTGNLDFAKLNQSIKQSGMTLQQYGAQLQKIGPQGQQAFMALTNSIAQAEIPLRRSGMLLKQFGTTLMNTAKWQISSTILHGFMSSVQSAYGYAQDLNESLNNIRIVTGQNIDQMAKFAQEANKAAKALSTTTTEYTNASLIYYQQGLSDQQVKERTDITIKMANVARQSAEVVSDQMTAVWNNFYDGSKSLEHYADVMTALGAATASSTDEIAGGLEKFAAIGNTIGLSFEYAASALATITSNTRQSEEVVGTALKTVFARIQGLTLGETLEDGTNLNKYSEALKKVGISIYDSAGELKNMDNILDEMATKWDKLSSAQQAALAQTVAGIRQYTQLIALMENWDNGDADSMVANLATSAGSTGALQEQADIYAESWEAAQDRVTAALEAVYSSLINDEAFIDLLKGVEKTIRFVNELIDKLGGLKGTLLMIGTIVTKVFHTQLSQSLSNMAYNMKMMTQAGRNQVINDRNAFINDAVNMIPQNSAQATEYEQSQQESMRSQLTLQQELTENASKMNQYELEVNKSLLDRNRILQEQTVLATQNRDIAKSKVDDAQFALQSRIMSNIGKAGFGAVNDKLTTEVTTITQTSSAMAEINGLLEQFSAKTKKSQGDVKALQQAILNLQTGNAEVQDCISDMNNYSLTVDNAEKEVKELLAQIQAIQNASKKRIEGFIPHSSSETKQLRGEINQLVGSIDGHTNAERKRKQAVDESRRSHEMASKSIREYQGQQKTWSSIIVEGASLAMNTAMAFSMLSSTIDTLQSPDVSGWQKFTSILMTLGMLIPALVGAWGSLKSLISAETVVKIANSLATLGQAAAERKLNKEKSGSYKVTKQNIKDTVKDTKNKVKNSFSDKKQSFKDNWNKAAFEKQGGTLNKNGTSTLKGRKGIIGKEETSKLLSNAGKSAAKGLGSAALSVAAIAAGIAVIAGGIAWGVKQAHKAEEAVKNAKERVKELSANFETVSQLQQEFESKASNYENATKGIEGLTKGTKEYADAVYKANQAAMELIESNENLKYNIEDGIITFEEGELEKALEEQRDNVTKATAAKMFGNQAVTLAEQDLKVRDYAREIDSKSDDGQNAGNILAATGTGASGGALIGAGIGGLVGGSVTVGTLAIPAAAVGAIIGGIIGAVGGLVTGIVGTISTGAATEAESDAIEKLAAAYKLDSSILAKDKESLKEYLSGSVEDGGLGIDDEELVNALAEDESAMRDLITEMVRNTEAIHAQNEQIINQALGDEEFMQNTEYADAITDRTADVYGQMVNEILESDAMKNFGEQYITKATGVNDAAKEVFDAYLKAAGLDGQDYTLKDTQGTDKKRVFVYLDKDGNEKKVSLSTMKYTMASAQALERMEGIGLDLLQAFNEWGRNTNDPAIQAVLSFFTTNSFGEATHNQLTDLQNDITSAGSTEAYLKQILGSDLEAAAEKFGYTSAAALIAAFEASLSQGNKGWTQASGTYGGDVNLQDVQSMDTAQTRFNTRIEGAGDEFVNGIEQLLGDLEEDEKEAAYAKIMAIDWSQYDAGYEVLDVLEEFNLGITEEAMPAFRTWVDNINQASGALYDFTAAAKSIEEARGKALKLEFGDTISKEDYESLVGQFGQDMMLEFFTRTATGEAKLTGDPLDFRQAVNRKTGLSYIASLPDLQNNVSTLKTEVSRTEYADSNFGTPGTTGSGYSYLNNTAGREITETTPDDDKVTFLNTLMASFAGYEAGSADFYRAEQVYANWFDADGNREQITNTYEEITESDKQLYADQIKFLTEGLGYTTEKLTKMGIQVDATTFSLADAEKVANLIAEETKNGAKSQEDLEAAERDMWYAEIGYLQTLDHSDQEQAVKKGEVSENAYGAVAEQDINAEAWDGLEVEEVQDYAKYLEDVFDIAEEGSEEAARSIMKMNKGVTTLNDNWEEWGSALKKSSKYSEEYADAMKGVRQALSDILDVSEDFIDVDFVNTAENLALIEKAATGDAEAIDALGRALAKDIALDAAQDQLDLGKAINIDGIEYTGQEALNQISSLMTEIGNLISGQNLELGKSISDTAFIDKMNSIVEAAGMTVEESNAFFRTLGFTPEFEMIDAVQAESVPLTKTYHQREVTEWGGFLNSEPIAWIDTEYQTTEQTSGGELHTALPAMATETLDGKGVQVPSPKVTKLTYTGGGSFNNFSSSNPGGKQPKGSSSKPKKAEKKKESDVLDRYKEIDDALDDLQDTMEDVNKATDRLYGASRIKQMQKYNDMIKDEIKLLEKKKEEAELYLELDRADLDRAAAEAGVSFTYDENGNVTNYTEQMRSLLNEYNNAVAAANADGDSSEEEDEQLDELDRKIEEVKSAMQQYEDTRELMEDLDNEMDDKFYEWQDNNAEMLSYKLEIKMELNDDELRALEYKLSKTDNDFYKRAEAAAIMGEQLTINTKSLGEYSAHLAEVEAKYAAGDISQEAYIEALDQINDGIYDNLNAIQDLDQQMMEYYGETLAQAGEEIDKFTTQLEKQTTILEHYKTLVDLMGKSTDYDKVGIILEGQANTTKNEMIAAREEYEMLAKEKDEMYLKWQTATTEEQAELYKKQYEAALEASDEAQEQYLSKAEAYGEALNAILENSLNKFGQDLENALTGGTSFDQMTARMERAASLQEEYLTTTNKIYETNKLMNKAQQEIDKSTNTVAKQRLKQFINETDQLQKKNRFSSYELEIQQAKYDLLLAEIALEEAQEAKSQVRLQRDAEGNFGYVYTADQDKISEAQQNLADAQNNLYNIALEGANGYAEKYYQTLNELYTTLDEINRQYHEGAFESEQEYQNAILEAKEYYYALLEDYSDLYTIAISTDARALEDSWSREFNSMIYNTDNWRSEVEEYIQNVQGAFEEWDEAMDALAGEAGIGGDLSNLSDAVDKIDQESQQLLSTLTDDGGVLDTIQTEIDAVSSLTDAYALQRTQIQSLTQEYEQLAEAILAKKRAEAMKEEPTNVAPSATPDTGAGKDSGKGTDTKSDGGGDGKVSIGDKVKLKNTGTTYYYDSYGTSPRGNRGKAGDVVTVENIVNGGKGTSKQPYGVAVKSSGSAYGWLKIDDITGYDTGGYTGKWGSYGKLAMLHEKELVLDKKDTENFLSSMELLNNIIQIIDLQAMNSSIGGALSSPGLGAVGSETLEQQVTIEANFLSATSRTEIEEALSTLVNRASQYANRK